MTAGFATLIIVLGSLGHWTEEASATPSSFSVEPSSSPNTSVASSNAPSVRSISASNMSAQASVSISSGGMNSTESNITISTSSTDSTVTSYNSKSTRSATNTATTSSAVNSPASSSTSKSESTFSASISTSSVTQLSTISASFTARSTSNTTQPDSIAPSSKTLSSSESSASKASSTPNETNVARSSRIPTQPEASQTSISVTSLASHVALASSQSVVSSSKTLSSVANTLPSLAFQVSFHLTGSSFVQTLEKVPSESPATESSSINESVSSTPTATIYTHSSVIVLTSEGVSTSPIPSIPRLTSSLPGSITSATPSSTPSSAFTPASQTPSSGPTIPQEGTKTVIIEVSLDIPFLNEYNDINSLAYKNLETVLKTNLTKVYQNVDGFVDVRILLITEGSVICKYVVILAKNSAVTEDKLKDILLNAGKETFPFKVQSVTLVRTEKPPKETLPQWALVTMIVLGVLAFVFIVVAICACVKYRKYKEPYYLSSGEIDMHNFEAVGYGNMRAKADVNTSTAQRRLVASHTNPAYGTKGNLDD